MPSTALQQWRTVRAAALDEIEQAHASVGGSGPGRRYATQQINQAYAMLLSSQLQGFCRDLHTECVEHAVRCLAPTAWQQIVQAEFTLYRKLDTGNPNPGNLGADFGRLGIELWDEVVASDPRNAQRRILLQELNEWRNAIAHQSFDPQRLGGRTTLHLGDVRRWRASCDQLAVAFDGVMQVHLRMLTGVSPW
jgi:hypothetical protein